MLGDNGAKYLEGIYKCATLTSLNLNLVSNFISKNGAKYLGRGISKCINLTSLDLSLF